VFILEVVFGLVAFAKLENIREIIKI